MAIIINSLWMGVGCSVEKWLGEVPPGLEPGPLLVNLSTNDEKYNCSCRMVTFTDETQIVHTVNGSYLQKNSNTRKLGLGNTSWILSWTNAKWCTRIENYVVYLSFLLYSISFSLLSMPAHAHTSSHIPSIIPSHEHFTRHLTVRGLNLIVIVQYEVWGSTHYFPAAGKRKSACLEFLPGGSVFYISLYFLLAAVREGSLCFCAISLVSCEWDLSYRIAPLPASAVCYPSLPAEWNYEQQLKQ